MKKHVLYRTLENSPHRREIHQEVPICDTCEGWLKIAPFEEVMKYQGRPMLFAPVPPPVVPKATPRPIGRPAKVQDILELVGGKKGGYPYYREDPITEKEPRRKKHPARDDFRD